MRNLKAMFTGAEELLRVTASNADAEYASVEQKLERNLTAARDELDRMEHLALLRAKHAVRATDG